MQTIDPILQDQSLATAPLLCLLNGSAGSDSAEARREEVAQAFEALNQPVQIVVIHHGESIGAKAREAAVRGDRLVVAGGGDGTVSAVANALAGTKTALAVLPLGTLNHFAKDLGIPLEIQAAVDTAVNGVLRTVDVAEVSGHVFINNSSIGLYPAIVRERQALQEDGCSKWLAFAEALLGVLRHSLAIRVQLKSADFSAKGKTEFIFVGNNTYDLMPPRIGARNKLDEGVLWVCRLPHIGRFHAVLAAFRALFSGPKSKTPFAFTTAELSIQPRRKRIDVAVDGEVISMHTPLRYRTRPAALRVIAPHQTS